MAGDLLRELLYVYYFLFHPHRIARSGCGQSPPRVIAMRATAYTGYARTASGKRVRRGMVAADPRVLPLGTKVRVKNAGMQPCGVSPVYRWAAQCDFVKRTTRRGARGLRGLCPYNNSSSLRRSSAERRGSFPPVETAICRFSRCTRAGTMKSHSLAESAMFARIPLPLAAMAMR